MVASSGQPSIILDACCLLNLYASRQMEVILRVIPVRFAAAAAAAAEVLYVLHGGGGQDARKREQVDLQPLIRAGILDILSLETEMEKANFVHFAAELADGEAMTCALAVQREAAVATDDRKAIRVLRSRAPHVRVHTTVSLLKWWVEIEQPAEATLKRVLTDVQERANFVPGRHDALLPWWQAVLNEQTEQGARRHGKLAGG